MGGEESNTTNFMHENNFWTYTVKYKCIKGFLEKYAGE